MKKLMLRGVAIAATMAAMGAGTLAQAQEDAYVKAAKEYIASITAPAPPWTGPTTGPKAVKSKTIVFVSADQRNGGLLGVSKGITEAAKVVGWEYRTVDGQGTVSGRATALTQAIAMKPDGIVLGSVDATEQAPLIEQAVNAGIKVVSWHSGPAPGKIPGSPIITNVSTDPKDSAKAAGMYAVAESNGTANVILFTDSIYKIATAKTDATAAAIRGCKGCSVVSVEDTPLGDVSNRMPQLTTALLTKHGKKWTHSIGVNDLYFDFMPPSLQSAGIPGDGSPKSISSGDGSQAAFNRIKNKEYQSATVAEPLYLHGWQLVDELNRAFAGVAPSGFTYPVHLFTAENVNTDGGQNGLFEPENGYRNVYRKIWGK